MTTTLQSASLHYREGNSDKVYHAAIEPKDNGYIVTFTYGRRGNTLNTGTKTTHPVSLSEATKVFDKLIGSKLAKGYHYTAASAGETKPYQQSGDEGRDSGIRCQLLNAVDESEVSRLLTNSTHCLQEKHDGRRLMVRKQGDTIKIGDRVQIVPEWQDPGDDRFERFVIEAPPDTTQGPHPHHHPRLRLPPHRVDRSRSPHPHP